MIIEHEQLARMTGYQPNQTERIRKALKKNGHEPCEGKPGRLFLIIPDNQPINQSTEAANDIRFD